MKVYRRCCCVCLVTFAFASCNGRSFEYVPPQHSNQNKNSSQNDETLHYLDLEKPELEQSIETADAAAASAKFVQVEVREVTNPQKRPVRFQVHYQPNEGERILLGSFSLYPVNNPGRFIVPTQGRVKGEGKIILSLVKSDRAAAGDVVRVGVKKLKFVNQ